MPARTINFSGQKFGTLEALRATSKRNRGSVVWLCRCSCGKEIEVSAGALRHRVSCGHLTYEHVAAAQTTHGETRGKRTLEYRRWRGIITRCENKNDHLYKQYGAKGIRICRRWRYSFEAFLEDMGRHPADKTSIDRLKNSKGYGPGNCRWANATQQTENRSYTILVTLRGETKPLQRWCDSLGLIYHSVYSRIWRGESPEQAIEHFAGGC